MSKSKKSKKIIDEPKEEHIIDDGEIINFYNLEAMNAYKNKYHNPKYNKETMPIAHPFRAVLVGSSGSMKTNTCLNIIQKMDETFEHIDIFTADKDEPLYNLLEEKIPDTDDLMIYEGLDDLNDADFRYIL